MRFFNTAGPCDARFHDMLPAAERLPEAPEIVDMGGYFVLTGHLTYHEVAPQLVLMAFLQRIVNGGGFIDREYGIGRYRMDLLVHWPYTDENGRRQWQREALELKVWRDRKPDPVDKGA